MVIRVSLVQDSGNHFWKFLSTKTFLRPGRLTDKHFDYSARTAGAEWTTTRRLPGRTLLAASLETLPETALAQRWLNRFRSASAFLRWMCCAALLCWAFW